MKCSEFTHPNVISCAESFTAEDCARMMKSRDIGFVPVTDENGSLVGTVTDRDLCLNILADGRPGSTPLSEVMHRGVVTCHLDDDLQVAENKMAENQIQRIVVADDSGIRGVISLQDLAQREDQPERVMRVEKAIKSEHGQAMI